MKVKQLFEASISKKNMPAAMNKMISYLERKLGTKLIRIPGIEKFSNSVESGVGFRFVFDGGLESIRFNWHSVPGDASDLMSIDYWTGASRDPSMNIKTKGVSFAQVLPMVAQVLEDPMRGKTTVFPMQYADEKVALAEAKRDDFTAETALADFLKQLSLGKSLTRSDFIGTYHIVHAGIFDTIVNNFAKDFNINGKRVSLASNTADTKALASQILGKAGVIEVSAGGKGETYDATRSEKEIEERVPFTETLDHLEGLVKGLIKGAFNALFVAGKGGTGKTQTVEDALHAEGLADGIGYFKNTGTASPAGVYNLLWHHRNDIILFDDSDGALADQDARNIIKAATDTKKARKLVWNKKSSFIFDPEGDNAEQYEDDPDMAPRYFDFKGRIIFISNLGLSKLDPDGALRTRAFVISVDPTDEELFEHMEKILFKIKLEDGLDLSETERKDVLEVVKKSKRKGDVSLRKLVRALNLAASKAPNWEKLVELYA